MKVAQKQASAPTKDPRTEPLPLLIDDAGLARQVQSAPTAKEAWDLLGLPGGRDAVSPDAVAALAAAVTALCATSDSIGKGLKAFGALDVDAEIPVAWVDRMATLLVQELDGYWTLDDLAYAGLTEGGWTVASTDEPPVSEPARRRAVRALWQAEHLAPSPALWLTKLRRALEDAASAGDVARAETAGRALVEGVARHRYTNWQRERRRA